MAYDENATVDVFLKWIQDAQGGLAAWVEHYLNSGDEAKLREISGLYSQIKAVFGF